MKKAGLIICCAILVLCMVYAGNFMEEKEVITVPDKNIEEKIAYLTFDDGPSRLTPKFLDVLKENQVKATFFLIGCQIEGDMAEVAKRACREGNELGVHTYCHEADKIYSSEECYYQDLMKTRDIIKKKVNYKCNLFRFPWGSANAYIRPYKKSLIARMEKENMGYADWNVSGEDSVGFPTEETILQNVRKDYRRYNQPVILLHDSAISEKTLAALPVIIKELKEQGYRFDVLSNREKSCHFCEDG